MYFFSVFSSFCQSTGRRRRKNERIGKETPSQQVLNIDFLWSILNYCGNHGVDCNSLSIFFYALSLNAVSPCFFFIRKSISHVGIFSKYKWYKKETFCKHVFCSIIILTAEKFAIHTRTHPHEDAFVNEKRTRATIVSNHV